jgi:hypothetical protein
MRDASITRRQFTLDAALALLAGCVITVSEACSGNKATIPSTPAPTTDVSGNVSANHGHAVTISAALINAGTGIVGLSITGMATHPHTISVSQNELASLRNRQAVTVTSTTDSGHNHSVTFTPA